jgi:hypothetical protein
MLQGSGAAGGTACLPPSFAPSPQAPASEEQVAVSQSRDLIDDVFMNTSASVILKVFQARCEYDESNGVYEAHRVTAQSCFC